MEKYSLLISILSFIVAFVALFFTHIRPAKIKLLVGNHCKVYYCDYDEKKYSFSIYIPIDFLNITNKTGTVLKTAIVLYNKNQQSERYFMLQKQFEKLDIVERKWVYDEMAHSIVVPPKSSVNKIIWYCWNNDSSPRIKIQKNDYCMRVYYWLPNKKPKYVSCELCINDIIEKKLEKEFANKSCKVVDVQINKEYEYSKCITEKEEKNLS